MLKRWEELPDFMRVPEIRPYYDILDKKEELEHFISFYFAQLQVPQLWRMPFVPFTIPYPV